MDKPFGKKQERGLILSWLPATVILLGILSGSGFWWLNHLNLRYQQFDDLIEVIYEIDRQVSLAHLNFHEQKRSDKAMASTLLEQASKPMADLAQRLRQDQVLQGAVESQEALLVLVETIGTTLADLQKIAGELQTGPSGKAAIVLQQKFNGKFRLFSQTARQVEGIMKQVGSAHVRSSLVVFRMIFVGWLFFVVLLLLALLRVEAKRFFIARALAESEEKFRTMTESARDAIVLADPEGRISYWNQAAERMFHKAADELMGGKLCDMLLPSGEQGDGQSRCASFWQVCAGGGKDTAIGEIQIDAGEGAFPVEVSVASITLGGQLQNIAILRDIRERKDAERALRENESLLRTLINAMPDFVCFKDGAGRWLMANEFGLRLFGIEDLDYQYKSDIELAEYNDFYRPAFLACIRSDEEAWQHGTISRCDEMVPRLEGPPFTFDVLKVPLFHADGSRKGLLVIGRDITARKNIEQALQDSEEQLRHLSASLFVVQETERRRIANELHDELGQALVALKMQVRALQRQFGEERSKEEGECDQICEYVNEIIENVRRLSRDLSPVVLDDLGLGPALQHMVDNFSELHDVDGMLSMDEIGHLLPPGAERIVYRIVQEALTNIAKHAKARNFEVAVCRHDRDICFKIIDDGQGFDPEAVAKKKAVERGLGLTAMSERVRMLGGLLDIESQPGHGTCISVIVPVQRG